MIKGIAVLLLVLLPMGLDAGTAASPKFKSVEAVLDLIPYGESTFVMQCSNDRKITLLAIRTPQGEFRAPEAMLSKFKDPRLPSLRAILPKDGTLEIWFEYDAGPTVSGFATIRFFKGEFSVRGER